MSSPSLLAGLSGTTVAPSNEAPEPDGQAEHVLAQAQHVIGCAPRETGEVELALLRGIQIESDAVRQKPAVLPTGAVVHEDARQ